MSGENEFALAQQVVAAALEAAAAPLQDQPPHAPPLHISEIHVRVGSLTGVVADAFRFGFLHAAAGTPAAKAVLIIEPDPAYATCTLCRAGEAATLPLAPCCARCGGPLRVTGGGDLLLLRILLSEESVEPELTPEGPHHDPSHHDPSHPDDD